LDQEILIWTLPHVACALTCSPAMIEAIGPVMSLKGAGEAAGWSPLYPITTLGELADAGGLSQTRRPPPSTGW
jgi:hypothetical protein